MTTYYVSKYALSGRIEEFEGGPWEHDARYIKLTNKPGLFVLGRSVHETLDGARQAAEAMRDKKIASLKKRISKIEKLKF